MNNPSPRSELFDFVLEKLPGEPAHRQARILRTLSHFAGEPKLTKTLEELAYDLEQADRRCREFSFEFSQKDAR